MARLDTVLVERGLAPTRSRAADLIRRGFVSVGGAVVTKAGYDIAGATPVALASDAPRHVSRGAEKLTAALAAFGFQSRDVHAVDIGASTGGFTEVLLASGAASVTAVDVGHGQLHPDIAANARVRMLEGRDARSLTSDDLPFAVSAVTADVSFISLEKALPAILGLAAPAAWLVALVKPQFEVGRDAVGSGGIVRDERIALAAIARVERWLAASGWDVVGRIASPLKGGDGNQEYLVGARKRGSSR